MTVAGMLRMVIWRILPHSVPVWSHRFLRRTERWPSFLEGDASHQRYLPDGLSRLVAIIGIVGGLGGDGRRCREHNGEDQMFDIHPTTPFLTRHIVQQVKNCKILFDAMKLNLVQAFFNRFCPFAKGS